MKPRAPEARAQMVQGQHRGLEVPFSKNHPRISATSGTFDVLSLCKCPAPLSKGGFRGSFINK